MSALKMYRKRLIPDECIELKDDKILYRDEKIIVTKWSSIHPKPNFSHGASCYFLKEGIKMSKFYRADSSLVCWYCDIVQYEFSEDGQTMVATDLLADVVIEPDGFVKVVDLDELAEALDRKLIDAEIMKRTLMHLNCLLTKIYEGSFSAMQNELNRRNL